MQRWKTVGQTMVEDDRGPWVNVVSAMEQLVKRDMWILELEEEKTALVSALRGMVADWERVHGTIPDDHEAKAAINKHKPPGEGD